MSRPNIELRIEKLVIHSSSRSEAERIARATRTHLGRLLAEDGIPGAARASVPGESAPPNILKVAPSANPDRFGHSVAAAVHGALGSRSRQR